MPTGLPADALSLMRSAVKRSRRSTSVRFPVWFVRRRSAEEEAPLARLLRGGEVRLKLYLTLSMIATKAPHDIDPGLPSRRLAELLDLADPDQGGQRRVNDALRWLDREDFLVRTSRPGRAPALRILTPGSESATSGRYVGVPLSVWEKGWLYVLPARALAVYMALLEASGGRGRSITIPGARKDEYDLSEDTWTRATIELKGAGLLSTSSVIDRRDFDEPRRRLRYTLAKTAVLDHGPIG